VSQSRPTVGNDILPFLQDNAGYSLPQFFKSDNKEFKNITVAYNRKIGFLKNEK